MQYPTLPVRILNQFCESINVEAFVPPYLVTASALSIDLEVDCEELEDPGYWKVQIGVEIISRNGAAINYTLSGTWAAIAHLSIEPSEDLSKEDLERYLANTVGGLLFGTIRSSVSTVLLNFGHANIFLPPIESSVFVKKLEERRQATNSVMDSVNEADENIN